MRMVDLTLIGVSEDERDGGGRRFLDALILVFEGLLQKMTEPDIAEEEEATSDVLSIISPTAVLGKGPIKRWVGERHGEHVF
jgi:hypothetical protein